MPSPTTPTAVPASTSADQPTRSYTILTLVSLTDLLILAVYLWVVTYGTWRRIPASDNVYDQLATSFQHGRLSLEVRPDPALLALPDPYDPARRGNAPYLPNMSLYNDKYYLYFGPAPALILALLKILFGIHASDAVLTFLFVCGIYLLLSFFAARIWIECFPGMPAWLLVPALLGLGLTAPYAWFLLAPGLNYAVIAAGEFFFLWGLGAALWAARNKFSSPAVLVAAGILWALALGSRLTQLVPVAFVFILLVIWSALDSQPPRRLRTAFITALWLGTPIAVGLASLAVYNQARFGSPFETGQYYQLIGMNLRDNFKSVFSPAYIIQNLYNYFLTLPRLAERFPYLSPAKGSLRTILPFFSLPAIYYSQELAGLLCVSPLIIFSVWPPLAALRRHWPAGPKTDRRAQSTGLSLDRFTLTLSGAFVFGLAPLLLYFWTATRFILDFVPSLLLLAILGFAQAFSEVNERRTTRWFIAFVGIALITFSIAAGSLVAVSVNSSLLKHFNPALWKQLLRLFQR